MNRLDLVAGPNGAGKSTFVELTLAPLLPGSVFVNADEIAKQRWPHDPASHAHDAALSAAAHPAGYPVFLHVGLIPEELAVARVAYRVQSGGHPVAENKIRERY